MALETFSGLLWSAGAPGHQRGQATAGPPPSQEGGAEGVIVSRIGSPGAPRADGLPNMRGA